MTMASTDAELMPNTSQVGGHMGKDSQPDTLIDAQGRFYKPFQADARSQKEVAFYRMAWGLPDDEPGTSEGPSAWGRGELYGPAAGTDPLEPDILGLRPFLPRMYGTREVSGRPYMIMENVCHGYQQPCVMDAKMGFTTVYDWGTDAYKAKCSGKDVSTTQQSCGFRISGLQVYQHASKAMVKMPREWGRTLTADAITQPFTMFADNGALSAAQVWGSGSGFRTQLQQLRQWFASQTSFCFFQASVLFVYEGAATCIEDAKPQVRFIDFAHTFPTARAGDPNVASALDALLALLDRL